jgi:3',5'-cyclic AMP phosphodiesterase CpdA
LEGQVENEVQFVLGHISDLHFSGGTDLSNPNHSHSVDLLVGLEKRLQTLGPMDCLLVTGDVSNQGDRQSLITANGYLFSTIPIGKGQHIGLKRPADRVRVIPGNHDAWNASTAGTLLDRRQKSLEHYNFAFPDSEITTRGCYFDWLEKEGSGLYLAFVDSCFLGDTEENRTSTFGTLRYDQAIAKGKLTIEQTEHLLGWHDRGMRGILENPRAPGTCISKAAFAKSLKILVMHHYLFEPPERKSDYFMRVTHRDIVFRNIALSDFDVLLCGHKHIASFDVYPYGEQFDKRAVDRYMINCFRRLIGLESYPIQFTDEHGGKISKAITWMSQSIGSWFKRSQPATDSGALAQNVFELLKSSLDDPEGLSAQVREYLHQNGEAGAATLEPRELKAIQNRLSDGLGKEERKAIKAIADGISLVASELKSRPFLQIMSGSSAKNFGPADRKRSFNIYRVRPLADSWEFVSERYTWDNNVFAPTPFVQRHNFGRKI